MQQFALPAPELPLNKPQTKEDCTITQQLIEDRNKLAGATLSPVERAHQDSLPNLIVIGAMKCGTTALYYYLSKHPQIKMSRRKEMMFFSHEFRWKRGVAWYRSNFRGDEPVKGEVSPQYTEYPQRTGVAERMYSVVPDAKLIYLVRDPIDRMLSHYVHSYANHTEHRDAAEALSDLQSPYVTWSQYFMQLEQYLQYYPRENILVVDQSDLYHNRLSTLQRVFRFLGVDDSFEHPDFSKTQNLTSIKGRNNPIGVLLHMILDKVSHLDVIGPYVRIIWEKRIVWTFSKPIAQPTISPKLREQLAKCFKDDVRKLRKFTGLSFESWTL